MPRPPLSDAEVEAFRERLCRIATRRFAEQGYAGVTLRGLAEELGCSPTTPYRYFRGKDEIFAAVRAGALGRLADASLRAAAPHRDPLERLRAAGQAYLDFARREPSAYRIAFELAQPVASDHVELAVQRRRAWQVLRDAVGYALQVGAIHGDADEIAHVLWAGLHGLVTLHLAGQLEMLPFESLVDPMLDSLARGAGAEAKAKEERAVS